jgi:SAM-dependent methyltransferase
MEVKAPDWFADWFDTAYYHILYKHRDNTEAKRFLNNLMAHTQLPKNTRILDLACGRGRHAMQLFELGYIVHGLDLSSSNIDFANKFAQKGLSFEVGDMRNDLGENQYHAVLNAFTSFGYFEDDQSHQAVFNNIYRALKPEGHFYFDYLNAESLGEIPTKPEEKTIEGIHFKIQRRLEDHHVLKEVQVTDGTKSFTYCEQVALYYASDFVEMLEKAQFEIVEQWGDYNLNKFEATQSPRCIIMARK